MDPSAVESSSTNATRRQPWDGFLASPENALAHASVIALASGDGTSPLVIHGASGVGKTRLLEGLLAERLARKPESTVAFLTAEAFASQCAEAAGAASGWAQLRERFRQLDLLALDDLHDLERAPLALTELMHTLDALSDNGGTRSPSQQCASAAASRMNLPKRLISRLSGGLAVRVEPPTLETRRRYVLDRLRVHKATLPAAVVEVLIQTGEGYRALNGLLARLALEKKIAPASRPLNPLDVLSHEQEIIPVVNIVQVARDVAHAFGVSVRDLRSASRQSGLVVPRHVAIYLAREVTGASFAALGSYFGSRDAATIRYACRTSTERLAADPSLAGLVFSLRSRWRTGENGES